MSVAPGTRSANRTGSRGSTIEPRPHYPRNPFATRCVRPGAIPYLFADRRTPSDLVDQLGEHDWMGQIVGPHGSGKSTLVQALLPLLRDRQQRVLSIALHDHQRSLPATAGNLRAWGSGTLIVIDGYEQLSRRCRLFLRWRRRAQGFGVLATTHQPTTGLPVVYRTPSSLQLTHGIVRRIAPMDECGISHGDIRAAHERCGPNVREVLFELYDVFRERYRQTLAPDET